MPFAHWRVSPPPQMEEERLASAAMHGDPPVHAGGFFGERGSVSASQRIPSVAMEGQSPLRAGGFFKPCRGGGAPCSMLPVQQYRGI
jgi:hypothetical protein